MSAGPWEKYASSEPGPWTKYQKASPSSDFSLNPPPMPGAPIPLELMTDEQLSQQPNESMDAAVEGASRIGGRGLSFLTGAVKGILNKPGVRSLIGKQYLESANPAEAAGKGAEQTLEFFAPAGAVSKGTKAVDVAVAGAKYAKPVSLLTKAMLEGSSMAGVAAMQGAPAKDVAISGGIGAGGSVAADALPAAASLLKKSAVSQYGKFLNPTKITTKTETENVIPTLLERKQVAFTSKGFEKKATEQAGKVGQDISDAVAKVPADVRPEAANVLNSLDDFQKSFTVNGVPVNEGAVKEAEKLKNMVMDLATTPDAPLSYQSLNHARQILDKTVAQTGAYAGMTVAEASLANAQKAAANAMRAELSRQSPEIAKLNAEYHFWAQVQDVIKETNARRVGQQGGLARTVVYPLIAAGAGFAHSGSGTEAAILGATMAGLNEAVRSPAWRTTSAVTKNAIANALASGNAAEATKLISRIAASQANNQ